MDFKTKAKCGFFECGRVFDLTDEADADEFYNGHDCKCGHAHNKHGAARKCSEALARRLNKEAGT